MSRERRFYVPEIDAASIDLTGDEAHHLLDVLRLKEGADVVVFDGKGHAKSARVARISGEAATLDLGEPLPTNESPLELTLAVAVPKGDTMSLIVQKLTELGVTTIRPLVSEHGEMAADVIEKRRERWERIALEAAKQCGRSRIPAIEAPASFSDVATKDTLMLTPGASELPRRDPTSAVVLVGPEGGWSGAEIELARARGVQSFGLGPRTLRTETAAIAAAALLQWLAGDFR